MKTFTKLLALMLCLAMLATCGLVACSEDEEPLRVIALKGPTGMGMAKMMEDAGNYGFQLFSTPEDVKAEIIKGDYDIAAVPSNLAAALYKATKDKVGALQVLAVNTTGVLYLLENGNTIQSIEDLANKTVYATGQGANPQYILEYLLTANNVQNVTVQYLTEHAELATKMAGGEIVIGMLPEPNVSSAMAQNSNLRIALNLTEEWEKVADGAPVQGCLVVRKALVETEEGRARIAAFLTEYNASVVYANENVDAAAQLIEKHGIVPKAALAKKALPNCNLCCVTGNDMKELLLPFLTVLHAAKPQAVGGAIPDDGFWYLAD